MEEPARAFKSYILCVEKLCLIWEGLAKKMSKPLCAVESLSEQLQSASSIDEDLPILKQFPQLHGQVIYKTLMSLEQELALIINLSQEVDDATGRLSKLASRIDQSRLHSECSLPSVSICTLLEVISDLSQYYRAQYAGLKIALQCLNYRDSHSVKSLRNALIEDKDLKAHAQRCLQLGKYALSNLDDSSTVLLENF